jgi:hypothetical protein
LLVNQSTGSTLAISALADSGTALSATSQTGTAAVSDSANGTYHHVFGNSFGGVFSAIARTTGALTFVGASADANRLAQTNEVQAVSFGAAQTLTAPQQVQARTNIGATATGGTLFTAATVDAARGTLGLAPQYIPPRRYDWQSGTWQSADTLGSATATIISNVFHSLATGATGISRIRRNINTTVFMLNRATNFVDWSKRLDIALQIRAVAINSEGVFRVVVGKLASDAFGLPTTGDYIALTVQDYFLTAGHVCKSGVVSNVAFTPVDINLNGAIFITSNNGNVSWFYNGILLGSTINGPTSTTASGTLNLEIENGATAANYAIRLVGNSEGH